MSQEDLYAKLGLSAGAEDIVIKAAYRALAQRYHPDKWSGDASEADRRMREINAAYAILSDKKLRAEYDRSNQHRNASDYSEQEARENTHAFDSLVAEVEARWEVACTIYPDLAELRAGLKQMSSSLSFAFVVGLLESKNFGQRTKLAKELESQFIRKYFGRNERINAYARRLITNGNRAAARHLNKLVDVIGSDVDPNLLIARVEAEFSGQSGAASNRHSVTRGEEFRRLVEAVRSRGFLGDAKALAEMFEYKVDVNYGGLFGPTKVSVITGNGRKLEFSTRSEFVQWAQQVLCAVA